MNDIKAIRERFVNNPALITQVVLFVIAFAAVFLSFNFGLTLSVNKIGLLFALVSIIGLFSLVYFSFRENYKACIFMLNVSLGWTIFCSFSAMFL